MQKVSIIIPAHNEQKRIQRTIARYAEYFASQDHCSITFIVVLNGCTDNTHAVVQEAQKKYNNVGMIELKAAGKGIAIKAGFLTSLGSGSDMIGFVDADMATEPQYFDELIRKIGDHDGIIASRYIKGAQVHPPRPFIKQWGRIIFYNSLIKLLFGLPYKDLQCGAKLFKYSVMSVIAPELTIAQWAFDVELLYLCKLHEFSIKEIPTVWYDQSGSKLRVMHSGLRMLGSVLKLRITYSPLRFLLSKKE